MTLSISTSALDVHIDSDTGRLIGVSNRYNGLELIASPPGSPPFRLELKEVGWIEQYHHFDYQRLDHGLRLNWQTEHAITLTVDITARNEAILFTISATNRGRATVDRIEYPIFAGIGRLSGTGQDELVHSHATGMLFHDPLDLFEPDPDNRRRLRYSVYPEGFDGSTMQMMAYYGRGRGGFYFGTEDGETALKYYNFFKEHELLCCTLIHKAPVVAAGADFAPSYPVVLAALREGTWYEAADRYKAWATRQPWAQPRPRSRWLREQVGICTFGVNARFDRSAWLDMFHRVAGTPVLHVLGPNWAHGSQDYHNNLPRGKADWFPARFSQANLDTIRRNGDYWAPFEFDLLCTHDSEFPDPVLESRVIRKASELEVNAPPFLYMCAGTDYWLELHVWRDEYLVREYGCDANYYDISVSNLAMQCLAEHHNHRPGAGTQIVDVFRRMYRDTSAATARVRGDNVPAGTEVISECFLREFDFYQARAEATPLAPFEADFYRDWIIQGRAETIPLFTYVYHENGPLRMDGWARLAREAGDLFYWVAARVVLNGGLLQLNYEFNGLEELDGHADDPAEHYFRFEPHHYAVDPAKAAFVGEVARTRVGPANPFLAYGTMLRPPLVEAPQVELDYFHYNVFPGPSYEERGTLSVPGVLATAWSHAGRTAWCVANLLSEPQHVRIDGKPVMLAPRQIALIEV